MTPPCNRRGSSGESTGRARTLASGVVRDEVRKGADQIAVDLEQVDDVHRDAVRQIDVHLGEDPVALDGEGRGRSWRGRRVADRLRVELGDRRPSRSRWCRDRQGGRLRGTAPPRRHRHCACRRSNPLQLRLDSSPHPESRAAATRQSSRRMAKRPFESRPLTWSRSTTIATPVRSGSCPCSISWMPS